MSTRPRISIIIPTYNRRESLRRTLLSFANQDYDPSSIEVLVADTGSTDGTVELVRDFKSDLHVRHLALQKRFLSDAPVARNAAAAIASGEILLFVDSDIVAPRHFVSEHIFCHQYVDHAFVGGAVCHMFGMKMELESGGSILGADVQAMIAPYQAGMLEFSGNPGSCRFPWSYCYGANYSFTRKDLTAKGLWVDENFAEKGVEACDTELSYRAHLLGVRIIFSRYAVAYHDLGTAPTFSSSERTERVIRGLEYICKKHPCTESTDYVAFRSQECEAFLEKLLGASKARTFPVLRQPAWLSWMERILGAPTPTLTILLFTTGDAGRLEKALRALQEQTCPHHEYEVLVCDASAQPAVDAARTSSEADLLVQKLNVGYCLRYYPAAGLENTSAHIGLGVKSCYADAQQLRRNLSRVGWYFSLLNNHGLLGRVRGRMLKLLEDCEEIPGDYVAQCIEYGEHELRTELVPPVSAPGALCQKEA